MDSTTIFNLRTRKHIEQSDDDDLKTVATKNLITISKRKKNIVTLSDIMKKMDVFKHIF